MYKGQSASLTKSFTPDELHIYAMLTGDYNRVHLDEEYAASTPFGRCIVHGKLVEGLVSAVIAEKLPGPMSVFRECVTDYLAPVYPFDKVIATVTVMGCRPDKPHHVNLDFLVYVSGEEIVEVMKGTAVVTLPRDKVTWKEMLDAAEAMVKP